MFTHGLVGIRGRSLLVAMRRFAHGLTACALAASAVVALPRTAYSQTPPASGTTISGRVVTDAGEPLPGASVGIQTLGVGAITNDQGRYTFIIPAARVTGQQVTILARFLGYRPQSRTITLNAGTLEQNFELERDVNRLSAIVTTGVAGETEQRKTAISVTRVDAEEISRVPAVNPLSALQGKVPGANIVSTSGQPGAAPQVLLRAPISINASGRQGGQSPLIVVDGIITNGSMADLNPLDIENVEVVKGAAAASLYGARAGNGVIQITTKSGRNLGSNSTRFNARAEYGMNDIERDIAIAQRHPWLLNSDRSLFCGNRTCTNSFDYNAEILRINSTSGALPLSPQVAPITSGTTGWNTFQDNPWPGQTYNQVDQIVDPKPFSSVTLDATGRNGQTNYFASFSTLGQGGAIAGLNGYRRNTFRLNVDQGFGTDWTLQLRSQYTRAVSDGQAAEGNVFFDLTRMPAGVNLNQRDSVRNEVIIRPDLSGENENPLYDLLNRERQANNDRFLGGVTLRYTPVDWFDVEGQFAYDRGATTERQFANKGFRTARTNTALNGGNILESNFNNEALNGSLMATARRRFGDDLATRLQLRYLYEQQDTDARNFTGQNLAVNNVRSGSNATSPLVVGSSEQSIRAIGYFAIANMEFKERYIVDALYRRDGSSLFGRDNRWADFYRVAGAWRLAQESWWFLPQADEFKLRAAVGTAGGRPNFAAQYETYAVNNGIISPVTLGNTQLRPEIVTEGEFGLDAQFFGRVGLTVNHSRLNSRDQILLVPLAAAVGFPSQWQNAGTVKGSATELALTVPVIQRRNFSYTVQGTWQTAASRITELTVPNFQYGTGNQGLEIAFYARPNEKIGTIYGRRFATGCGDLPSGENCANYNVNDDGYLVWVGQGNTWRDGVAKSLWGTTKPDGVANVAKAVSWGTPFYAQDGEGETYLPLGNTLPKFRWALNQNMTWGRIGAYALLDASVGNKIYNQGRHWSYFENYSGDQDQIGKSDETKKPINYYGTAGLYDVLQPNSAFVEDGSYVKLREFSLSYRLGRFGQIAGDWNVSLIGRNLLTFTNYKGFDPEVGITGGTVGNGVVNAFDAYRFPNLRSFTLSIGSTF
jgi:TonB-linked SusC/RagA family outer membrane protein